MDGIGWIDLGKKKTDLERIIAFVGDEVTEPGCNAVIIIIWGL